MCAKKGFTPLEIQSSHKQNMIHGRNHEQKKSLTGFTLIELLVVIAVIGMLASIVLVSLGPARGKARDARRLSDLKQIQLALQLYYDKYGDYPNTGGPLYSEGRCVSFPETTIKPDYSGANAYIPNLAPEFIAQLPGDPNVNGVGKRCYVYAYNGTTYNLSAHLGGEGSFSADNPLIRLLAPACTETQPTFTILSTGGRCW